MIRDGDADVMLAGGAESTVCPIGIAGFAQARALNCSFNDRPEAASRPYDKDRDGFVMGEGAGVVCLEEYEHAGARRQDLCRSGGLWPSGDAYHVTAPHPEGLGAFRSMEMALKKAGMTRPTSTMSTPMAPPPWPTRSNWRGEAPVRRCHRQCLDVFHQERDRPPAGRRGRGGNHLLHPGHPRPDRAPRSIWTIRTKAPRADLVPHVAKKRKVRAALNNSFGFGGTNASVIVKALEE
jgi:3-oxoacyl-[acyl-carrier-protein] synthase II